MDGMRSREEIDKGADGRGRNVKTGCGELAPRRPLPEQEQQSKNQCHGEPRHLVLAGRNCRISAGGSKNCFTSKLPSSQLHTQAAEEQYKRVHQQKSRKLDRDPVFDKQIRGRTKRRQSWVP